MRLKWAMLFLVVLSSSALAQDEQSAVAVRPPPDPSSDRMLVAAGFLDGHPDLRFRRMGLERYTEGKHPEAFKLFTRAGYYADKPSQAIVAEMLWIGLGVDQDRALSYVWMDLAAERGYVSFARKRSLYWEALSETERQQVEISAPSIRSEYADIAAEPRLNAVLLRERRRMTGSRLASQSNHVTISVPGHGAIDSSRFYDSQFWEPEQYRAWHDAFWQDLRFGRVDVGDVVQLEREQSPLEVNDTTTLPPEGREADEADEN